MSSLWSAGVCRVSSLAAPHDGPLWRCVGGGLELGGSWEGAGHAGSECLEGGGRVCGFVCSPSAPSAVSSSAFPLPLSLCMFVFFGGGVRVVGRFWCLAWAWMRAAGGVGVGVGVVGDGWLLPSGFPVCVSALRHLVAFRLRGPGLAGAGGGWLAAWWRGACVGGRGS